MQKLNRVLGLDAHSKAVPGVGGKSDSTSLGGNDHVRPMLVSGASGSAKVLPRLNLSQFRKPAQRQQETVRSPEPYFCFLSYDFTTASAPGRRRCNRLPARATDSKIPNHRPSVCPLLTLQ